MENKLKLNLTRIYKCDAKTLFQAISEGGLFKFTGAKMDKVRFDFRTGGKIHLEWDDCGPIDGVFTEVTPHSCIAFTWELGSTVKVMIKEHEGKSTLTLVHDGFNDFQDLEAHHAGWKASVDGLYDSLLDVFAKIENNQSGLDLNFHVSKTIRAPRSKVFQAVVDGKQMQTYFGQKTSGPMIEGTDIEWLFEGHEPFKILVQQVIENELVKFQWGASHVAISFRDKSDKVTEVFIQATGWPATQAGLDNSYSECDGWMEFLILLRDYLEKGAKKV